MKLVKVVHEPNRVYTETIGEVNPTGGKTPKWIQRKNFSKFPSRHFMYELGFNEHGGISGAVNAYCTVNDDDTLTIAGSWYHFYGEMQKQVKDFKFDGTVGELNKKLNEVINEFNDFALKNGTTPYDKPACIWETDRIQYVNEEFAFNYPWRNKEHTH